MRVLFNSDGALEHCELYNGLPYRQDWVGIFYSESNMPIDDGHGCILVTSCSNGCKYLYALDLETDTAYEIKRH